MISNFEEITTSSFSLGDIVATKAASEVIPKSEITEAIERHASGDWGDVAEEDKMNNDLALEKQGRLVSGYATQAGTKFWLITESDRSVTTIFLTNDY
jgi:hypothetical protein